MEHNAGSIVYLNERQIGYVHPQPMNIPKADKKKDKRKNRT
jgi:hypothetical protein